MCPCSILKKLERYRGCSVCYVGLAANCEKRETAYIHENARLQRSAFLCCSSHSQNAPDDVLPTVISFTLIDLKLMLYTDIEVLQARRRAKRIPSYAVRSQRQHTTKSRKVGQDSSQNATQRRARWHTYVRSSFG